jgi:hypothetical protein
MRILDTVGKGKIWKEKRNLIGNRWKRKDNVLLA